VDGTPKAKTSVDKTRRVLRLALAWAAERRIVSVAARGIRSTRSSAKQVHPDRCMTPG
jgi:hypothetical protein